LDLKLFQTMYEWREHTAEVELHVRAESPEAVLADAVDAFGRLVEEDDEGEPAEHPLDLEGRDLGDVLVRLLDELVYLADTASFVPDAADLRLEGTRLAGSVRGRRAALDPLVKAATYHRLSFAPDGEGWRARVVLDV
jgi:SHS2 domain-containing protein